MSENIFNSTIYLDDIPKEDWHNYIANGYRNICYILDNEKNGNIVLFGFNVHNEPTRFVCKWKSHVKFNVKFKTDEKDIYGRFVVTKEFRNIFERKKWIEAANGLNIIECLRPEQEFAQYMWSDFVFNDDFNKQPLRIHYFDIETEISAEFMLPSKANNRINMMTIYDSLTEKFYTWSLLHAEINFNEEPLKNYPKNKFVFFEFDNNERKMLEHFLSWYEKNYPDVNFGWNTKAYDIPYLVRRIENVLGKKDASRLSPINKYYIKEVNHLNSRADAGAEIEVNIDGLFVADGLILYRDKFQINKPDGGFSLDNIGEVEECGNKIQYSGTLKDLYLNDYQKFYEYNVRDVDLAKRIEDKCKMIPLARTVTSFGLNSYQTIYSSISYLIGSVIAYAKTKLNSVMCSYLAEKKEISGFEGAFVFPTQAGVYKKGIGVIDFASLYPSIIQAFNISPETYCGKILIQYIDPSGALMPVDETNELYFDIFDDKVAKNPNIACLYIKYPNGNRKQIDLAKLREWIKEKGIYTANNTIFLKHEQKQGVISKWCEYFYGQRKTTKKKMLAIFHELHNSKNKFSKAEIKEKEAIEQNLNSRQLAMKTMINSIYGTMGTSFSPIANLDIAQTITRVGRFCNTQASIFVRKMFNEKYDKNYQGFRIKALTDDSKYYSKADWINVAACGGDTDSCAGDTKITIK